MSDSESMELALRIKRGKMKYRFTPEDFEDMNLRHDLSGGIGPSSRLIAERANAKLEEWERESVRFIIDEDGQIGFVGKDNAIEEFKGCHEAILWNPQPIKEEKE